MPVLGFCEPCTHLLVPRVGARCTLCDILLQTVGGGHTCGRCLDFKPQYDQVFGLYEYSGPIGQALKYGKYGRMPAVINRVAQHVANNLPNELFNEPPAAIIPVPSHWMRIQKRGLDSALIIAQRMAKTLNVPLKKWAVKRTINTVEQAGLDVKARRRNLKGAFRCTSKVPRDILLVDDVFTTGATAHCVSKGLRKMGAERIRVLCAAYVDPEPACKDE